MVEIQTMDHLNKMLLDPFSRAATTEITKYLFAKITKKMENVYAKNKINVDSYEELAEKFSKYLEKSYREYSSIPTLALKEKRVSLKDIYQPLTLKECGIVKDTTKESIEYLPQKYDNIFFKKHSKLIIFDNAGMGKSTFLKFLFLSAMQQKIQIPIFIELRHLKHDNTIIDEIYKKINYLSEDFHKENILQLINDGDFLFFLDGYDEISRADREKVSSNLKKFINHAGDNRFIITSRPDAGLNLASFEKFEIKNLKSEEAFSIIRKYDNVTGYKLQEDLIKTIKNSEKHFKSFLENPMFVSLLYVTFKNKRELPLSQGAFYRTVYDALYSDHDLTKDDEFKRERGSDLSRDGLEYFFKKFAHHCFKHDISDFERDPLLNIIREVLKDNYFTNKDQAHDIFIDITQHVPLITKDGINYKWIHKSFMEYFTSQYISTHTNKVKFLESLKKKQLADYENILKIYVDIDKSTFDSVFLEKYLKEFITHIEMEPLEEKIIKLRELTFSQHIIITQIKGEEVYELLMSSNIEEERMSDELGRIVFKKMNSYVSDKYPYFPRSMRTVPDKRKKTNHKTKTIDEVAVNQNIVFKSSYVSSSHNTSILLKILHEKKYAFLNKKSILSEETIIKNSDIFDELNHEEGNELVFDKNTRFNDLNLNLDKIYAISQTLATFDLALNYRKVKNYLKQMQKQSEEVNYLD